MIYPIRTNSKLEEKLQFNVFKESSHIRVGTILQTFTGEQITEETLQESIIRPHIKF